MLDHLIHFLDADVALTIVLAAFAGLLALALYELSSRGR